MSTAKLEGYDRLKKERLDIVCGTSPKEDGMPRGSEVGNPTKQRAIRLAYINATLDAIDQLSVWIQGKYTAKVQDDFDPVKAFWNYDYFNCQHIRNEGWNYIPPLRRYIKPCNLLTGQISSHCSNIVMTNFWITLVL